MIGKARVLYIDPKDGNEIFNDLCSSIIDKMVSEGILERDNRPFKVNIPLKKDTFLAN